MGADGLLRDTAISRCKSSERWKKWSSARFGRNDMHESGSSTWLPGSNLCGSYARTLAKITRISCMKVRVRLPWCSSAEPASHAWYDQSLFCQRDVFMQQGSLYCIAKAGEGVAQEVAPVALTQFSFPSWPGYWQGSLCQGQQVRERHLQVRAPAEGKAASKCSCCSARLLFPTRSICCFTGSISALLCFCCNLLV
jgi:hypothetical protein